ncbi:MAG TPA: hypothetical protein VI564_08150 [Candidatus Nanoarchaeia archaeon]|nr:hypothetical protein [Candidatus Nanoarchaeia archaeon]
MKKILLGILVVMVLVLSACKPNDQANADNTAKDNTKQQDAKPVEKTEEKTAGAKPDVSDDFKNFLVNKDKLEWQITYDLVSKAQGTEFKSKMVQYFKGAKKMRTDVVANGIEARTFFINDVVTSCSKMGAKWNCYSIDVPQDKIADVEKDLKEGNANYKIEDDGTKVIVGKTAKCFKVTGISADLEATVRYCFSSEGAPLYVYFESPQATTEMTALLYETVVNDRVFDLPAEPTKIDVSAGAGAGADPCAACGFLSGEMKDNCLASC